jgi:hypothetical protein
MRLLLSIIAAAVAFALGLWLGNLRNKPAIIQHIIEHRPCATNNIILPHCPKAKDMTDAVGLSDRAFWDTVIACVDGRVTRLTNINSRTWHDIPGGGKCMVMGFGHTTNDLHFRITAPNPPDMEWLQP